MSAINALNDQIFSRSGFHTENRSVRPDAMPVKSGQSSAKASDVSVTTMLGFLLALVSAALLLMTGQPPWFLLTPAVALAVIFFLPQGSDLSLSE